jgi:hypothetical protein
VLGSARIGFHDAFQGEADDITKPQVGRVAILPDRDGHARPIWAQLGCAIQATVAYERVDGIGGQIHTDQRAVPRAARCRADEQGAPIAAPIGQRHTRSTNGVGDRPDRATRAGGHPDQVQPGA